jgi:hypothetical protein
MPYDGSLFERAKWEIAPSQRFMQNWQKFTGTFNLAFQLLTANYAVGSLVRPIAFFLLVIYLTIISILSFQIIKSLAGHKVPTGRNGADLDMLDMNKYRQKYMERNWHKVLFLMIMWGFLLGIFVANSGVKTWLYSAEGIKEIKNNCRPISN